MDFKDYYQTLGVARDATAEEIKKAYRKLARKYHPDVSKAPDAQSRMREVNEAWEVLGDAEKRLAYDRVGEARRHGAAAGAHGFEPPPGWDAGFEFSGGPEEFTDAGYSDFFETLFGNARRRARGARPSGPAGPRRGTDHHARIMVPLEDSFNGAQRELSLAHPVIGPDGVPRVEERRLRVQIPKGIRAGQQIRLAGQGAPGLDGAAGGDLYLEVMFEPHPRWRVDGRDLHADLPVAPWEAALGARIRVETPGGPIEAGVPAGSQGGRRLRLRGRGLPCDPPGDLYLQLRIVLPSADDPKARALYERMAQELAFDARAPGDRR